MTRMGPDDRPGYIQVGVTEGYDRWAPTYDRDPNPLIVVEESHVLELAGDVRGCRILDLGCGTGRYDVLLAQRGAKVLGIDSSPAMLQQALRNRARAPFEVVQGTLDALCFADGCFDLVVCALTLNHVEYLEPVFREATRVLRKDGVLIISDFHPYWIVFGHGYTEFVDDTGQEYRITCYQHLLADYWRLSLESGLRLEELREPRIDDGLVARFPPLEPYRGVPLALIMKLSYVGNR